MYLCVHSPHSHKHTVFGVWMSMQPCLCVHFWHAYRWFRQAHVCTLQWMWVSMETRIVLVYTHNKSHLLLLPQCIATYRTAHSNKNTDMFPYKSAFWLGRCVVCVCVCACIPCMCADVYTYTLHTTHVTIVRFFFHSVWQNVVPPAVLPFTLHAHKHTHTHMHAYIRTNKQWNQERWRRRSEILKKTHINIHSSLARHFRSSSKPFRAWNNYCQSQISQKYQINHDIHRI